jgi:hypothetical protein
MIVRDATGDDHVASVGGLATIGGQVARWPRFRYRDRARGPLHHHGGKLPTAPTTKPRLVHAAVALIMAIGRAMVEDEEAKGLEGFLTNPIFG